MLGSSLAYLTGWHDAAHNSNAECPYEEDSLNEVQWYAGFEAFQRLYPEWRGVTEQVVGEV